MFLSNRGHAMNRLGLLTLVSLTSCLSPSPPNGELGCDPQGACPTGYYCAADNTCFKNGSVGPDLAVAGVDGGGGDAGEGDGGVVTPDITVDPTTRNFGTIVSGSKSAAGRFTVTNPASSATGSLMVELSGTNAADFVTQSDNCTSVSLVAHGTCTVDVVFQPRSATTGAATAILTVSTDPGGSATAQLSGNAVAPGALTLTPTMNDFMKVEVNKASTQVDFTVKNTGGSASGVVSASLSGTDMDQFTLVSDCAGTLASNATCLLHVTFTPKTGGMKSASLTATAAPGGSAGSALTGSATLANGTATTVASQCTSGIISGGVCCNMTCTGSCVSCTITATKGTCSPQPTSVQCGTTCKDTVTQTNLFCNGAGACNTTGTDVPCVGYACGGGQCKASCAVAGDCQSSGGYSCSNTKCVKPETDCLDGVDNNGDGLTDCADPSCTAITTCVPAPAAGSQIGTFISTFTPSCPTDYGSPVTYSTNLMTPACSGCGYTGLLTCKYDVYMDTHTDCSALVFKGTVSTTTALTSNSADATNVVCANMTSVSGLMSGKLQNGVQTAGSCTATGGGASRGTPTWGATQQFCAAARSSSCAGGQVCVAKPAAAPVCLRIPSDTAGCPAGWTTGPVAPYYTGFVDNRSCGACTCSGLTNVSCINAGNVLGTQSASCPGGAPSFTNGVAENALPGCLNATFGLPPFSSPVGSFGVSSGGRAGCACTSPTVGVVDRLGGSTICCR